MSNMNRDKYHAYAGHVAEQVFGIGCTYEQALDCMSEIDEVLNDEYMDTPVVIGICKAPRPRTVAQVAISRLLVRYDSASTILGLARRPEVERRYNELRQRSLDRK